MAQVTARTIKSFAEAIKIHADKLMTTHDNHTEQEFQLAEDLLLEAVRLISAAKITLAIK